MKNAIAMLFCLITLAGFALPANAQWQRWLGYDPLQERVADNLGLVAELNAQYEINRVAMGLAPRGYLYAGGYRGGYRGEYGEPIGRRERTVETTAACAAIGVAAGGLKGLLYGAGGCLAGNVLYDVFSGRKVRKLREAEARMIQTEAEREEREAERQAKVHAEREERQQTATLYNNRTGRPVNVLDGNDRVAVMQSGETIELPEPQKGYRAARHFKARNGLTVFKPAENRLERDGSISFITPEGEVN